MKGSSIQTDKLILETQNMARTARDANNLTEESIRARLAVKDIRLNRAIAINQQTVVVVEIENIGNTTASTRTRTGAERWKGMPDGDMPVKQVETEEAIERGGSRKMYLVDKPATTDFLNALPIRIADPPKSLTTYFFGRIDYTTLSKPHHTEFCAYLMRAGTDILAISVVPGPDPNYMLFRCPKWVSVD
jgi:hypothetical protein